MPTPTTRPTRRHRRDIVVIGASAGGVSALLELVKTLPADFPAPIFIVQHVAPDSPSILPQLLSSVSALKARHPQNGETIEPGVIYVAQPDHHLLLEGNTVLVTRGPKENRFRPSIDALFRSAAYTYGPRVIGVILTGYLDDGTSGLWSVQRMGGLAVVQDPHDAEQPSMPTNALEFVKPDYLVPLAELGSLLVRLTTERAPGKPHLPAAQLDLLRIELTIAKQGGGFELGIIDKGKLTPFTCPDCHGALTQLIEGKLIRYRCHTGHAYTVSALLGEVTQSVESLLYQSMRGLEETSMLLQNLGQHYAANKEPAVAELFFQKAANAGEQARVVHASILGHEALSGDLQFRKKKLA
ncbi:chemotaxis protein CheB [Hymenobacter arizonensis]|uniref:protein-glutamate methylesterase n=1 Tax=Hymenobacter arizonensis TaxID=1227077 RepID=A0A1I5UGL5_HYMAR|nr:chemotaxis protein CheB [Hymenobacter arizonensis]SFP94370.1 two-component system, chemotaxis family, response regulator CheB [Hymenobacter arizonensis]